MYPKPQYAAKDGINVWSSCHPSPCVEITSVHTIQVLWYWLWNLGLVLGRHSTNWVTSPAPNCDFLTQKFICPIPYATFLCTMRHPHTAKSCVFSFLRPILYILLLLPNFGACGRSLPLHMFSFYDRTQTFTPHTLTPFTLLVTGLCREGLGVSSMVPCPQRCRD